MPRDARKNVGASVRAKLLDRARKEKTDYQVLLTRYALERLLYRLGISEHRDRFVLKGAMLFITWLNDPFRPTRDLDLLGFGANDSDSIAETFKAICQTEAPDDGVIFSVDTLTAAPIREDVEYGGVRVQTHATIDGARIPIQVDIGFGDAITPAPLEITYPVLLDSPAPRLRAYPAATVVAGKFNAIVVLGIANSRLKDYYDLWFISNTFTFELTELRNSVKRTFERRDTPIPKDVPVGLSAVYGEEWSARWKAFLKREQMNTAPEELHIVLEDLRRFLMPLIAKSGGDAR